MTGPTCDCRGLGTLGVACEGAAASWVAACEAVVCTLCASLKRCCACGAPASGHYRLLVTEHA